MGFGLCFGGWGIGNCGDENTKVETTFTQSNETVMEFLHEVAMEFEANQESQVNGSNNTEIGLIKAQIMMADGPDSINKITITADQENSITATSQISSLIEIINSMTAKNDAKLDALATLSNAVENSSVLASAGSASHTNVSNRTEVHSKSISKISNTLNQLAIVGGTNNFTAAGVDIGQMMATNGGKNMIEIIVKQKIELYNKMLIDLVNNSESLTSIENGAELKADIEQMLKAQQKSILDGLGDTIKKTLDGAGGILSSFSKPLLYIVIGIVAIVLLIILVKAFSGKKQQYVYMQPGMYGGGLDDPEDLPLRGDL